LEHFKEENLCSNYFRIYALWEFPRKTLAEDITYRALLKQPFEGAELRRIILQLAEGLSAYEKNRKSHECLTTKSVLLATDNSVRVADVLALPAHPNLEIVYQKRNTKNTYLSPEHCRVIASGQFDQSAGDPFKEDVFIAGMMAMECALLERQDDCYQQNWEGVNWEKVREKLAMVENRYGRDTRIVIEQMLEETSEKRIDWQGIIRALDPRVPLSNQSETRGGIVRQSFVRENLQGRPSVVQRVSVPVPPPVLETVRRVEPTNGYFFTYNSRQFGNTPIQQAPVPRFERTSYEQGPVIRVVEPAQIIQRVVPQVLVTHQNPIVIRPPNARVVPIETSMSSKFTPIALSDTKPRP
jgi:hypothetical protein